jgi:hypothetical protein
MNGSPELQTGSPVRPGCSTPSADAPSSHLVPMTRQCWSRMRLSEEAADCLQELALRPELPDLGFNHAQIRADTRSPQGETPLRRKAVPASTATMSARSEVSSYQGVRVIRNRKEEGISTPVAVLCGLPRSVLPAPVTESVQVRGMVTDLGGRAPFLVTAVCRRRFLLGGPL